MAYIAAAGSELLGGDDDAKAPCRTRERQHLPARLPRLTATTAACTVDATAPIHAKVGVAILPDFPGEDTMPPLRMVHAACQHPACQATRALERVGARLVWGKGRHCEIAAVAAAGPHGLLPHEVVEARRAYARHLGVDLRADVPTGDIADSDEPIHVEHALTNFRGAPTPTHPINLGRARAAFRGGSYSIQWP